MLIGRKWQPINQWQCLRLLAVVTSSICHLCLTFSTQNNSTANFSRFVCFCVCVSVCLCFCMLQHMSHRHAICKRILLKQSCNVSHGTPGLTLDKQKEWMLKVVITKLSSMIVCCEGRNIQVDNVVYKRAEQKGELLRLRLWLWLQLKQLLLILCNVFQ